MIKNRKIATKLILMLAPISIALIAFVFYFSNRQISIYKETEEIFNQQLYQVDTLILNADRDFYQAALAEEKIYSRKDLTAKEKEEQIADFDENIQQTTERFHQAVAITKAYPKLYEDYTTRDLFILVHGSENADDPDGMLNKKQTIKEIAESFDTNFTDWKSAFDLKTNSGDFEKRQELFSQTREHLNSITDLLTLYSEYSSSQLNKEITNQMTVSIIIASIIFSISILLALYVSLYLRKSIKLITHEMVHLAENDLSITPMQIKSKDELGKLSQSGYMLFHNLQNIINNLKNYSTELISSSTTMNQSSNEINTSLQDMENALADMSKGAASQANDTEDIASDMGELNNVMSEVSEVTNNLSNESKHIEETTAIGMEKVNELLHITEQNTIAFNNIFHVIENISISTEKINEASRLISDIAEQTNLLSLNASIEAARAGESGKGFAVVAGEIRALAEQSAESVQLIDNMLNELRNNRDLANEQSAIVKDSVDKQNDSVNDTKKRYIEIVEATKLVNKNILNLEQDGLELEKGFTKMTNLIQNLSAVSEENSASSEELLASTSYITTSMDQIKKTSDTVNNFSIELSQIINKFKL